MGTRISQKQARADALAQLLELARAKNECFLYEDQPVTDNNTAEENWIDIMSSGYGYGEVFRDWHKHMARLEVAQYTDTVDKKELFKSMYSRENIEEFDLGGAEVAFARKLLTTNNLDVIFEDELFSTKPEKEE